MLQKLHLNTVSNLLFDILNQLMHADEFNTFRLVGGTALSLQKGHRYSIDIDLFTDEEYDSINFDSIDSYLRKNFNYVDTGNDNPQNCPVYTENRASLKSGAFWF